MRFSSLIKDKLKEDGDGDGDGDFIQGYVTFCWFSCGVFLSSPIFRVTNHQK